MGEKSFQDDFAANEDLQGKGRNHVEAKTEAGNVGHYVFVGEVIEYIPQRFILKT